MTAGRTRAGGAERGPGERHVALLLLRSAERAIARWRSTFADAVSDQVLESSIEGLLAAASEPVGAEIPAVLRQDPALLVIRRTLLDFMRAEFLRESTGTGPMDPVASTVLGCVRRLEEVREAMEPAGEAQVSAGLMGPGAQELLAEIGHDLRSPLTSVLFLSDALATGQSGPVTEHQSRQLALIYSASLTMLTIVNNFVELSRRGTEPSDLDPTIFSVEDVLEAVRGMVQPMAAEKGLDLRFRSGGSLGLREGHPVALSRVLLNLTTNALKFTDAGWVEVETWDASDGRVGFAVTDTGPGIDAANEGALFRAFHPAADSSGMRFSGSGLGLIIVRKLLRSLGAQLECESTPGRGTRFAFTVTMTEVETGS